MAKFRKKIELYKSLFGDQLWDLNDESLSNAKKRLVKFIKLTRITLDEYAENRMGFQCVALSYYVAMSIIPFVAFIFVVGKGFGILDRVISVLNSFLPVTQDMIDVILEKATNIINVASSSSVGLISAFLFLWSIIWLMFQVERVMNNVWKIRKIPRKLYKRFSFYIFLLLLSPFVLLIFVTGIALYSNMTGLLGINQIEELRTFTVILGWLVFYGVTVLILSVMFTFIPATDVKYKNAFWAAVVDSAVFVIFQYLYLETQVFVTRINGVYGALAAVPLFMIWLNYSWQIVVYGEQLCYGIQNVNSYNIPDGDLKDFTPYRDRLKKDLKN